MLGQLLVLKVLRGLQASGQHSSCIDAMIECLDSPASLDRLGQAICMHPVSLVPKKAGLLIYLCES